MAVAVTIRELPEAERPRERLLARGVEALSERELLALVLRHGWRGESALDLAGSLLAEFGNLQALASARPEELARRSGVGVAKAAALVAAFQLGRLGRRTQEFGVLKNSSDVAAIGIRELAGLRRERVLVLVADAANRLRRVERVSEGSIDRAMVPVREILNAVLRHDGRSFAVVHNHPSDDPTPSDQDRRATRALAEASSAVGLRFLAHVVVAGERWEKVVVRSGP